MGSDLYWEDRNMPAVCTREHVTEADAQAYADVRTLDDFSETWRMSFGLNGGHSCSPRGDALGFFGDTPEAARALAAAWVLEQAKETK